MSKSTMKKIFRFNVIFEVSLNVGMKGRRKKSEIKKISLDKPGKEPGKVSDVLCIVDCCYHKIY